jgi:hypothetical protein
VTPEDSDPIADETALFRRINPAAPHLVRDDNHDCWRISTGVFRDPDLSVDVADTLERLGREPATVLDGYPGQFLVSFAASVPRVHGLEVARESTETNPAHGVVRGKKRKPAMKALALACAWVVRPDDACEPPYSDLPTQAPGETA